MQRVNDLVIRGKHAEVAKLVERIERNQMVADWERDLEAEKKLNAGLDAAVPGAYCFQLATGPLRPVSLILGRRGWDELHVSSLITRDRKPLSDIEYNRTLGDFYANVLIPMSVGIKIVSEMNPPRVLMHEYLSPEAMNRLEEFSLASNKETVHIPDWPKWNRFVIQAHRDGAYLSDEDLDYWLMSDGFSQENRQSLLGEFESGRTLLRTYDEERVY